MGTFFDNVNREAEAYIRDCVSRNPSDTASIHVPKLAAEPPAFLSQRPPPIAYEIGATGAGYVLGERDARDADMQAKGEFSGLCTGMKDLVLEKLPFSSLWNLKDLILVQNGVIELIINALIATNIRLGIGCSMPKTAIAKKDLKFKTKEADVQNLQKANVRDETDAADLLGLKYQPVMDDGSNTSGGLSLEAHLESQSSNSDEPLDWKKVVLGSISFMSSNLSAILGTNNWSEEEFLVSKILASCSEEISMLFQSEASFSTNEVVSVVSFTTIKHFCACIGFLQNKMRGLQSMNHKLSMEVDRLNMEIEAMHKCKALKRCCQDDICKCP